MNVSNLHIGPTVQRQNPALAVGGSAWQERMQHKHGKKNSPLDDALKRLSDNVIDAQTQRVQQQTKECKAKVKTDIFVSNLNSGKKRALEDLSDDELLTAQHIFKQVARFSQLYENELASFRDQLSGFDQTINGYQDMLDDKLNMSGDLTKEDVQLLLETAKSSREQFLNDAVARLNGRKTNGLVEGYYDAFAQGLQVNKLYGMAENFV